MNTDTPRLNKTMPLTADPWLKPYLPVLKQRAENINALEKCLLDGQLASLTDFAAAHHYYGMHFAHNQWLFREWAPNAEAIFIVGDFSDWKELPEFAMQRFNQHGDWEITLPGNTLWHQCNYRLKLYWSGGSGERIPAYADYVVQDDETLIFSAQVWHPARPYKFKYKSPDHNDSALIYEAHIGMAQEDEGIGSFTEFREKILPHVAASGYNIVQFMAIMNHPYYGSFGYHVASFFSIASRFGTPDEFKALVDEAHRLGLRVIIDLVHSHAVTNSNEGIARFDGTEYQYFHAGERGQHKLWDSLCFDYGKNEVIHFLLSNCRYWLETYQLDGFRMDGVTSMLYLHHGLGYTFSGYDDYFSEQVDGAAYTYLALANRLIHTLRPDAITIAEDVSGMPGLTAATADGGCGFDYRLAMGITDYWFKLFDLPDNDWSMAGMWHELTNHRGEEKTISYVECHDQAIVGGQSAIFRMIGADMYHAMRVDSQSIAVDRGIALHKMIRLITIASANRGYLNFIGNEFGHPEWVDFPRQDNNWSYKYARRQWSLSENHELRFRFLVEFDRAMLDIITRKPFYDYQEQIIVVDDLAKIIAFERNGMVFIFNFHPDHSLTDYKLELLPGRYNLVLNSDSAQFGGFNRVVDDQVYFTAANRYDDTIRHQITLYLPCRTAIVLAKQSADICI